MPKQIDAKLNFCCSELKFKLNRYICANTIDVVKNFAVIKSVTIKSFPVHGFILYSIHRKLIYIVLSFNFDVYE